MSIVAVSGFASKMSIEKIDRDLRQIAEVAEPLEEAVLEMQIVAGEAARSVLDFVRDLKPQHLEIIRDSEAEFAWFAAEYERLAETEIERQLGQEFARHYAMFKARGGEIIAIARHLRTASNLFRDTARRVDELLDDKLRTSIDSTTPDGAKKLHLAFTIDDAFEETNVAVATYAAHADITLRQKVLDEAVEIEELIAVYRESNLSADEMSLLGRIDEELSLFVRAGGDVMTLTDTVNTHIEEFEHHLWEMNVILGDQIYPLIHAGTIKAATKAKASTAAATLLLLILGAIALLVGVGSAWALSRRVVDPVRELVRGTEIIGDGTLTHRIDIETQDEFGKLASGFNRMSEKLQRAQRSAEEARAHLEKRVEERTVELKRELVQRKRAEVRMRQAVEHAAVANRTKSEFMANMSHELRTPLNAIIGFSEMIQNQTFGPVGSPKYLEYVCDINDSGEHLLALINDILDLSKIEAGKLELNEEDVDVLRTVQSCITLIGERAASADVGIEQQLQPGLPRIRADGRKLKQILLNLLTNAIKFTPAGGRVVLRVAADFESELTISVIDTGIGIAAEDIAKAMVPFGQVDGSLSREHQGTGLGLPLTKALAELHGGSFKLESKVGTGTTATVRLPIDVQHRAAAGASV